VPTERGAMPRLNPHPRPRRECGSWQFKGLATRQAGLGRLQLPSLLGGRSRQRHL